jgi:hypothetical protein
VGGDGIYYFKNNQWLITSSPDFPWDEGNCADMDNVDFEYDIKGLRNKIVVTYPTGEVEAKNVESFIEYGERMERLDNDLMPTSTYAQGIADYLLTLKDDAQSGIEFTLENRFPDMLDMGIGKIIGFRGISYVAYGVQWKFDQTRRFETKIRTKKWVAPPPTASWYDYTPFTVTAYINNPNSASGDIRSQSFKIPASGKILGFSFHHGSHYWPNYITQVKIYAADVNGHPTGPVLATSDPVRIWYTDAAWYFPFSGANQINLVAGTQYCATFTLVVNAGQWNLKGRWNSIYTNGVAAYSTNGGASWTTFINNADHFFSIKIQTP